MTIYRTWSDMPQLLGDLMTREWAGVVAAIVEGDSDGSPAERLVTALAGGVQALRDNELFVRIVELDPELLLPYLLSRRGRSQDAVLGLVEDWVRAGQKTGDVRTGDPVTIARALVLATHGFVLSAHTMVDDSVSEEALDAELVAVLTRALAP